MKLSKYYYILIFLLPALIEGCFCRTTKKISAALVKKDTAQGAIISSNTSNDTLVAINKQVNLLSENKLVYKTLKAKAKVTYADTKKGYPELNAYINIKHNEKIWVRVAVPGIDLEIIKALITPDSIIAFENKGNILYKRTFSYLQEATNLPFDFETIENLLAGNTVSLPDSINAFKYQGTQLSILSISKFFKEMLTIDTSNHKMVYAKLDDRDPLKNRTCQIAYSSYENIDGKLISMTRDIVVSEKNTSNINIMIKDVSFDREDLNFSIKLPKRYKIK